jgi:hypothetical protein
MRTATLLVAIGSCAVLMPGICMADPPSNPSSAQVSSENRQKTIDLKNPSVTVALRQNKSINDRALGSHSPAPVSLTKSSPKNLRSHGASPATIGGPANTFRNAAAINGTDMKRKP